MNEQPESNKNGEPTIDPELQAQRERMQGEVRARTAHSLLNAIHLLLHGHPFDAGLSALASALVELGAATVGFETTLEILMDARRALEGMKKQRADAAAATPAPANNGAS